MTDKKLIRSWGSEDEYFKELEEFYRQHANAQAIVIDEKLECPVQAVYVFRPHLCYKERQELIRRLAETPPPEEQK
jgi:predicted metal-dependent RNase